MLKTGFYRIAKGLFRLLGYLPLTLTASSVTNRSGSAPADQSSAHAETVLFKCARHFRHFLLYPIFILTVLWAGYIFLYGNFHQVDQDFYRSAQLFSFNMPYVLEKHRIKSIINLRGPSRNAWYREETVLAKERHIRHIDFGIGDREVISYETMKKLVDIMREAPKPVLVHCKAGADRTSLAAALYLYAIKHDDTEAEEALSVRYGHFPWLGSRTVAMDQSFNAYRALTPGK